MRIQVAIIVAGSLFAGEAAASSFLQIEGDGAQTSRSVMVIPQAQSSASVDVLSADGMAQVSRSIIAISEPPTVSNERVAAINSGLAPAVLRGGVFGDALPAPVAVEEEQPKPLSRPEQRKKERDDRRAVREAIEFGEPLPKQAETQEPAADQPTASEPSGS
ncbi:MAG: hypothetical protein QM744_18720 [Mesorhizobium sp.]